MLLTVGSSVLYYHIEIKLFKHFNNIFIDLLQYRSFLYQYLYCFILFLLYSLL